MLPQLEKLPFTLQQAINFRMCARSQNVKQAALALGVSPGAVSRNVASIEQVLLRATFDSACFQGLTRRKSRAWDKPVHSCLQIDQLTNLSNSS